MLLQRQLSASLLALLLALPAIAAEFRGLEREMTAAEQARAGLDRLSPEQRAALDDWLRQRFAADSVPAVSTAPAASSAASGNAPSAAPTPAPSAMSASQALNDPSQMGFAHYSGERQEFSTRIVGSFRGWSGRTLFRLENGQVWQQSESGSYELTLDNPEVRLRPKAMGSWMLVLKHNNRGVRVRRVE